MTAEELLRALWRQKWIVLLTVVVATAATYFASRALPAVYEAKATLYIQDASDEAASDFEAIQSAQVLARTYAELIQSENVANRVADRVPGEESGAELLERMSFQPLPDTQLITVTAQDDSAAGAARLADTYADVFTTYVSTGDLGSRIEGTASIADPATIPQSAIRPRPKLYAAIAAVLALFLGSGLALLRDRLSAGLGTPEEISEALGLPVLARVPAASRSRTPFDPIKDRAFAEGMRVLHANLHFISRGDTPKSLLITSPGTGEGKSSVCVGLAAVAAEHGVKAAVIEGDLRRPGLSEAAAIDRGVGLTSVLQRTGPPTALQEIAAEPIEGVTVFPAGAPARNPSALLQPDSLHRLFDRVSAEADFLVIDSPPVSAGADAMLLSQPAQATVLVVNQRRTSEVAAQSAVRQLRQAGAHVLGVVVNEVDDRQDYYGYGVAQASRRGRPAAAAGRGSISD